MTSTSKLWLSCKARYCTHSTVELLEATTSHCYAATLTTTTTTHSRQLDAACAARDAAAQRARDSEHRLTRLITQWGQQVGVHGAGVSVPGAGPMGESTNPRGTADTT